MEAVLIFHDYYYRSALSPSSPQSVACWSKEVVVVVVVEPPFDVSHDVPREQKKIDLTAHDMVAL